MNEALDKEQPLPWWRRILLWLILAAIAALSVAMLLNYFVGRLLGAEIVKISQSGQPITFTDLQTGAGQLSADEDAGNYYAAAFSQIHQDNLSRLVNVNNFYLEKMKFSSESELPIEFRQKVDENLEPFRPVLATLDKGATLTLSGFDIGIKQGAQVCQTYLQRIQAGVTLLSLRTLQLILQGESDMAVDSIISILKIARVFDFHPTMTVTLSWITCIASACDDIRPLLEYGKPSEKSLVKLQDALSEIIPPDSLERMFLAERVYQIEVGRNLMPGNIRLQLLDDELANFPERLPTPGSHWTRLRLRQRAIQYFRDMAKLISAASTPWPGSLDMLESYVPKPTEGSANLLSNGLAFAQMNAGALVIARCNTLIVAIERYRRSHGEPPETLDKLVGTYIDSIPLDPFTGKKLLYQHDKESYMVYSVNINRQDDGGDIELKADKKGISDMGFRIRFRSTE